MSTSIPVSNNISWSITGFGSQNLPVVSFLMRQVDGFLSQRIGHQPFTSKRVIVVHGNDRPMCCDLGELGHVIFISSTDNRWCQFVFQFAHEYCHHLIDGELLGVTAGLKWFEESLCHVSSIANIVNMATICADAPFPELVSYLPSVITYFSLMKGLSWNEIISACLPSVQNPHRLEVIPHGQFVNIRQFLQEESEVLSTKYSDDHYHYICRALYPHFHNNPNLWKIILNLGETTKWHDLPELYEHLLAHSDSSYKDSLVKLFECML